MSRTASDVRKGWNQGIPCDDTVSVFRARHRKTTYRKAENKELAELKAENRSHIQTLFTALDKVEVLHAGILRDGDCV